MGDEKTGIVVVSTSSFPDFLGSEKVLESNVCGDLDGPVLASLFVALLSSTPDFDLFVDISKKWKILLIVESNKTFF